MIKCQLRKLIAEKQIKEDRRITHQAIHDQTGIHASTLSRLENDRVSRFDAKTISALCSYFNCSVGDLLVYIEEVA